MRRASIVLGSLLLAACAGPRPPGALDLGPGEPPVSPDAIESARPPDPDRIVARRGGDIMLYPADEAAGLKRQRAALDREFAAKPKLDPPLPR